MESTVLEDFLGKNNLIFYSISPLKAFNFRKSTTGENKNNNLDAESVARFAITMDLQGKLEEFRNYYIPDRELRTLTRNYRQITISQTKEKIICGNFRG